MCGRSTSDITNIKAQLSTGKSLWRNHDNCASVQIVFHLLKIVSLHQLQSFNDFPKCLMATVECHLIAGVVARRFASSKRKQKREFFRALLEQHLISLLKFS